MKPIFSVAAILMWLTVGVALAESIPESEPAAELKSVESTSNEVVVDKGNQEMDRIFDTYIEPKYRQPNTERTVSKSGIDQSVTPGQTNSFLGIKMLPSVNVQTSDPYGLGSQSSATIR